MMNKYLYKKDMPTSLMTEKKIMVLIVVLASLCACTGQGEVAPKPTEVIMVDAELTIESQDYETGDVFIQYTLILKNISDETIEKVVLKDFNLPPDIVMEKEYFEISNIGPNERKFVTFAVIVEGWGRDPKDQKWEIDYTIRIEKGSAYTEEDVFYYQIHLYPG
jgi:hypothetical protein